MFTEQLQMCQPLSDAFQAWRTEYLLQSSEISKVPLFLFHIQRKILREVKHPCRGHTPDKSKCLDYNSGLSNAKVHGVIVCLFWGDFLCDMAPNLFIILQFIKQIHWHTYQYLSFQRAISDTHLNTKLITTHTKDKTTIQILTQESVRTWQMGLLIACSSPWSSARSGLSI